MENFENIEILKHQLFEEKKLPMAPNFLIFIIQYHWQYLGKQKKFHCSEMHSNKSGKPTAAKRSTWEICQHKIANNTCDKKNSNKCLPDINLTHRYTPSDSIKTSLGQTHCVSK
jgi:hypothetical protein